jgi:hypothetical protein
MFVLRSRVEEGEKRGGMCTPGMSPPRIFTEMGENTVQLHSPSFHRISMAFFPWKVYSRRI